MTDVQIAVGLRWETGVYLHPLVLSSLGQILVNKIVNKILAHDSVLYLIRHAVHSCLLEILRYSALKAHMIHYTENRRKINGGMPEDVYKRQALMTGGQSSVWRAVVMGSLLLAAPLFGRETDSITSLSAALLVLLMPNPYAIFNVGLQLSFAAVAGLACFGGKLYDWMTKPLQRVPRTRKSTWRWRGIALIWRLSLIHI